MRVRLVFLGYNRPEYFTATIDSWRRALVGFDMPATLFLEPSPVQDRMASIFSDIGSVVVNSSVRGINSNNWHAIQATFATFPDTDAVIVAEDDVIVSDDAVHYLWWALNTYQLHPRIGAVCAFDNIDLPGRGGMPGNAVVAWPWFFPWVWATWRDRWETVFRDRWAFDPTVQGWDARVWELMQETGLLSLIPVGSRSRHVGTHGVHMLPELMGTNVAKGFQEERAVIHRVWEEFTPTA